MTCPVCGAKTRITDVRPQVDFNRRRRRCIECGYRFTTYEVDKDIWERRTQHNETHDEDRNPLGV